MSDDRRVDDHVRELLSDLAYQFKHLLLHVHVWVVQPGEELMQRERTGQFSSVWRGVERGVVTCGTTSFHGDGGVVRNPSLKTSCSRAPYLTSKRSSLRVAVMFSS